jgi:RNA ligase
MTHPARLIPYDTLYANLEKLLEEGVLRKGTGDEGLVIYCYSEKCTFEKAWDETTLIARGIILDTINKCVVATPFPKFFNAGENGEAIPDLPFETFEKLDGSLIIVFYHNGRWKCATKGSLNSEQAQWATRWIGEDDVGSWLQEGTTYLAECIYPENRIVVRYTEDKTGLHLLGGYREDGTEIEYEELRRLGTALSWSIVARHSYSHISEILAQCSTLPVDREGFVIRFNNGHRLKIKGDEYCRIHRMVSRLTPLAIWENMWADLDGSKLIEFRKELPEEFWADFDNIIALLTKQIHSIGIEVATAAIETAHLSDKEIGLMLDTFSPIVRKFIFPYRKNGGKLLEGRVRDAMYRYIRPDSNRLDGYVPSSSMSRIAEEL